MSTNSTTPANRPRISQYNCIMVGREPLQVKGKEPLRNEGDAAEPSVVEAEETIVQR